MTTFEYIGQKLDIVAAWTGVFLGILAISLSFYFHFNQEHVGFAVLIPSLLYLALRDKLCESKTNILNLNGDHSHVLVSFIVFIVLFLISLLLLRSAVYQRPLSYFITVTLIAAVIAYQILNIERKYVWFVLIEILLVSINIRGSVYFLYSEISWDIPYFITLINEIINTSQIPSDYPGMYDSFFMMPLTVAAVKYLFGLNMKYAYFSIGVIEALSPIFIFLVCKQLFNFKAGLMAALILALSDHYIAYGFLIIAMSLGIALFALILFLAIQKVSKSEVIAKALLILALLIIILTHTIATVITFVVIAVLPIAAVIIILLKGKTIRLPLKRDNIKATFTIAFLFFASFIIYWMNVFSVYGSSFFANIVHSVNSALTGAIEFGNVEQITPVAVLPNYLPVLLANIGYVILLILATLGILISLSFESMTNTKFALVICAFTLMAIIYIPSAFNFECNLPGRWFPFLYIFLSIFAASGIFALANQVRSRISKNIVVLLIVSVLVFFMITAPVANPDNMLYSNELHSSLGVYDSEVEAGDFAASKCVKVSKNAVYYYTHGPKNATAINPEKPETYNSSTLLIRDYDLRKGFFIPYSKHSYGEYKKAGEDFVRYLGGINIIYDNGKVTGYA